MGWRDGTGIGCGWGLGILFYSILSVVWVVGERERERGVEFFWMDGPELGRLCCMYIHKWTNISDVGASQLSYSALSCSVHRSRYMLLYLP